MTLDPATRSQIEDTIKSHKVVLFMKGNKMFPQCGFSAAVVGILKELGVQFEARNVLSDAALREGIKAYSDWPTIPQLYVDGQFLGGCDIVREMHASGELAGALGVTPPAPPPPPRITVTDAAAKAFRDADEPGEDKLRMEIDESFRVDLFFGPKKGGDIEVTANGVAMQLDPASARRAEGVSIDFVDGPEGAGFHIENPNAPARPKALTSQELKTKLDAGEKLHLFDVRSEKERATARIEGSILLDEEGKAALEKLPKDATIVFHCHHGIRSQAAAEHYASQGWRNLWNLTGGIDAWSRHVDQTVPRY
jgi:monothiol glutaredoxin